VDLTFTDLRQLADAAAGLCDVVSRYSLCRITGELVEAVEYRAQLGECVEATIGSLRKLEALLFSERPLNELSCRFHRVWTERVDKRPDHTGSSRTFACRAHLKARVSGELGARSKQLPSH
jgi:hypothetical protein